MHIFITGGTRGIGFGLVQEFLKRGHRVSYTGTSQASINKHKDELDGDAVAFVCDVRNIDQIRASIKASKEYFGNIDIFINNAGVDQERLYFHELDESEIKRVVDINILGVMNGTKAILEDIIPQGYGTIYNLEGLGSNNMVINQTIVYGSTKRLVRYFSKAVNKELKKYPSIHLGTIQPGMVFTDLLTRNLGDDGMKVARFLANDVTEVADYVSSKVEKKKRIIAFPTYRKALRNTFLVLTKKR